MDKTTLLEVLNDWNFWSKELDSGVERSRYLDECFKFLKTDMVVALIGVRRSGKSYLMRQMITKLMLEGTNKDDILMVNLEDVRFPELYPGLLDEIYETYVEVMKPKKKPFVFLDEVHNIPNWERWVRTLHELGKAKIVVSGSSSKLLSGELATVLTGRHLDVLMFPLSFNEFLDFRNIKLKSGLDFVDKKIELRRLLSEYIEFGGFPEVVNSNEKKQILLAYFGDIVTKDIELRHNIREREKLTALARFYLTHISNSVTYNSIRKFLNTATVTVEKFSAYLEEANLVFFISRFSHKFKERESSPRKVYSIDVGLANAVGFRFSPNIGRAVENIVAIELKRKEVSEPTTALFYWKDPRGYEVDFVLQEGTRVSQLIQVCWTVEEYKTKERELRALVKASKDLKCRDLFVITGDYEAEEEFKGEKIRFVPLLKWLLEDKHENPEKRLKEWRS